jgi:hypothetical protein
LVDATPRALAAVVIAHVEGEPRRTTGDWSDWNDPLGIEAQVDYGADPEGTGGGEVRSVRIVVRDRDGLTVHERPWLRCRPAHEVGGCEESTDGDATVLYRWFPGYEEEEAGSAGWTVVRPDEVVQVIYEGDDYYEEDPRLLDLGLDLEELREAAVDPAMSLRTTTEAWEAGQELDHYEGVEKAPEKPEIVPTTPQQLARHVADYLGIEPRSVRRSRLDALGPDAVGAHLEFEGTASYDPFSVDILTATGRARQIDPLPCRVQRSAQAAALSCFAWDADSAATWTLASADRPGVLWIIGAQQDESFNRVESVAIKVVSAGIVEPFFTEPGWAANRVPEELLSLGPLTSDLQVGPQTRLRE